MKTILGAENSKTGGIGNTAIRKHCLWGMADYKMGNFLQAKLFVYSEYITGKGFWHLA